MSLHLPTNGYYSANILISFLSITTCFDSFFRAMFSIERRLNVILIISRRGGASVPLRVRETTPGNRYFEHQRQPIFFLPRLTLAVTFHDWPHTSHYTQYRDDGTISIRVEKKETIFNDDKKASSTHPRFEYACPFTSIRGFIKSLSLKRGEGKKESFLRYGREEKTTSTG